MATVSSLTEILVIALLVWAVVWLLTAAFQPSNAALNSAEELDPIFSLTAPSEGHQLFVQRGISEISSLGLETLTKRLVYRGGNSRIVHARFSRDGSTMMLLTLEQEVVILRDDHQLVWEQGVEDIEHCCLSTNGARAVIVSGESNVRSWNLSGTDPTSCDYKLPEVVSRIALDPKGDTLVVSTPRGNLDLYDAKTGSHSQSLSIFEPVLCDPVFTDDGKHLAIAGGESVTLYDMTSRRIAWKTQRGELDYTQRIAISPDGRFVALGSGKSGLQILETSKGKVIYQFPMEGIVKTMAFSRTEDLLYVVAGIGQSIRVWSLSAGKELAPLGSL